MKFGRTIQNDVLQEWRFYAIDYKSLKQCLKGRYIPPSSRSSSSLTDQKATQDGPVQEDQFWAIFEESKGNLGRFYESKEKWALSYVTTLDSRLAALDLASSESSIRVPRKPDTRPAIPSFTDPESSSESDDDGYTTGAVGTNEKDDTVNIPPLPPSGSGKPPMTATMLKAQYLRTAHHKHFKAYIYSVKSLKTFDRELALLTEFLEINYKAYGKILKKFDKLMGTNIREKHLISIMTDLPFLISSPLPTLRLTVQRMLGHTISHKPLLPPGWGDRKVYTIGCFDLFHRGHGNVLESLREFGHFVVAGIHDDASYFKLKKKMPIDNLEKRMENVKPYVDQIYVIPSTDPLLYIKSMVSQSDIEAGQCCYARGDDMLDFPSRPWVESVMPIHFVPRTEACSSSLIRTIYHSGDSVGGQAAFAETNSDGKPVDMDGKVIRAVVPQAP